MTNTNITKEEKKILKRHLKTSPLLLVRLKSYALLMRDKDVTVKDIADIVSRNEKTVSRWLRDWHQQRLGSIFTGHAGNKNAGKLTAEQKEAIKVALREPPSAYEYPARLLGRASPQRIHAGKVRRRLRIRPLLPLSAHFQ